MITRVNYQRLGEVHVVTIEEQQPETVLREIRAIGGGSDFVPVPRARTQTREVYRGHDEAEAYEIAELYTGLVE